MKFDLISKFKLNLRKSNSMQFKKYSMLILAIIFLSSGQALFAADQESEIQRETAAQANQAETSRQKPANAFETASSVKIITVKKVIFKGQVGLDQEQQDMIEQGLIGKKFSASKLQKIETIFSNFYLENGMPDARVQLSLGKEEGVLIVSVKGSFPLHASYEFNNLGSKYTHRARHILHLSHDNLLGFGDTFRSSLVMAEQGAVTGGLFSYVFPHRETGTAFYFDASVFESQLQREFRSLNINSHSFSLIPGVRQRIWRNEKAQLDWNLQFEIKNNKTNAGDSKLFYDRMRVITTGPRFNYYDKWGKTSAAADVHIGIPNIMGGSHRDDPSASRVGSGGDFVYGTGSISRLHKLPKEMLLSLEAAGQVSPSALTVLEQMYLGGMYSVRGYSESDSAGDSGYRLSSELRFPPYFIPKSWEVPGLKGKKWRDAISLFGFIEGGQVFNQKRQLPSSEKNRALVGTGFGARFYISPDFNIEFDYGIPIGDPSTDGDRNQIHLSARIGF